MFILKNIQAYFKTFGIIIPIIFIYFFTLKINYLTLLFLISLYSISILYFIFYIYKNKNNNNNNNIYYNSIFKDKEYLLFKENLFKFYYSTLIILFYFLFKKNFFFLLLELNYLFILLLLIIIIVYSLLFSEILIIKLFKLILEIKNFIKLLNEINMVYSSLDLKIFNYNKNKNLNYFSTQSRNFSTYTSEQSVNEIDNKIFNLNENLDYNTEFSEKEMSVIKETAIKDFKKVYRGGYLGYNHIYSLGSVVYFLISDEYNATEIYIKNLEPKLKDYLNEIPENITYSILPVLKWQTPEGEYKSLTITNSIKITRYTSKSLLARRIVFSLQDAILVYELRSVDIDLFLMGRPWLSSEEFNLQFSKITEILDEQIEKEISSVSKLAIKINDKTYSEKAFKLQNYGYRLKFMDNYGEPIFDKKNILIGYKLNEFEYASIKTYYNDNNLLCNEVSIREFDEKNLSFKKQTINSWVDIKTEFGFIREYNKKIFLW